MTPNLREQLEGAAGILERAVSPAVEDNYAAGVLESVVYHLRRLSNNVESIYAFLDSDNAMLADLLASLGAEVEIERGEAVALSPALEARNESLRGQLSERIRNASALPPEVLGYLRTRSERHPLSWVNPLPTMTITKPEE